MRSDWGESAKGAQTIQAGHVPRSLSAATTAVYAFAYLVKTTSALGQRPESTGSFQWRSRGGWADRRECRPAGPLTAAGAWDYGE
jgi:hypothetical protein